MEALVFGPTRQQHEGAGPPCSDPALTSGADYSGTRIGHAFRPNAEAYKVRPVRGSLRQGRKTYRYPGGGGGRERFAAIPASVPGDVSPCVKTPTSLSY